MINYVYVLISVLIKGLAFLCTYLPTFFYLKTKSFLPPPFLKARYGNLHTFPRPTETEIQENKKSNLFPHWPLSLSSAPKPASWSSSIGSNGGIISGIVRSPNCMKLSWKKQICKVHIF